MRQRVLCTMEDFVLALQLSKRPSVLSLTLFILYSVVFQISKVKSGTPIKAV